MTRKKFCKKLMALGVEWDTAAALAHEYNMLGTSYEDALEDVLGEIAAFADLFREEYLLQLEPAAIYGDPAIVWGVDLAKGTDVTVTGTGHLGYNTEFVLADELETIGGRHHDEKEIY